MSLHRSILAITVMLTAVAAAPLVPAIHHTTAPPLVLANQHVLTLAGAKHVVAAAVDEARRLGATSSSIAVVDAGGHLIYFERLDGTVPATPPVATGKARTAAIFQKPTRVFEEIINGGRTAMMAIEGFTPMQGGIPIVVDGHVIGAIGVSGAGSAPQDEEIAIAGANAITGEG